MDKIDEYISKCELILTWSETNRRFNSDFVRGVHETIKKYGKISEKQMISIDNIIKKWRISSSKSST